MCLARLGKRFPTNNFMSLRHYLLSLEQSGMLQEMKEKGALPGSSHSVLSDLHVCIYVVCLDLEDPDHWFSQQNDGGGSQPKPVDCSNQCHPHL